MHLMAKVEDAPLNKNSPQAAIWLMRFFEQHHSSDTGIGWVDWIKGILSTHPSPEERADANIKTWAELNRTTAV